MKPPRGAVQADNGRVDHPGIQPLRIVRAIGLDLQLHMGRVLPQPLDQGGDQNGAGIGARRQGESPRGGGRIECLGRQGVLKLGQSRVQGRTDLEGPRGGLDAAGAASEQGIIQGMAQAAQGMADRRLGQAQPGAGARRAALLKQGVEHP